MTELSVVIITKNQAWNISRLIESVIKETAAVRSYEVVVVDSASSDDTVKIAAQHPISVLRLSSDQPLSPSAGRYIGYHNTTGKLILFLDGDMELVEGWLQRAVAFLNNKPQIALVTGEVIDLPLEAKSPNEIKNAVSESARAREVLKSGGAALYRRSVLDEIGTFNPYLYSDEEPELCIRIRHAGYRIFRLDYPIVYHYTAVSDKISSLYGRWKRRLYLGAGQSIRYNLGSEILWTYIKERGFGLAPIAVLILGGMALLAAIIFDEQLWLYVWLILIAFVFIADAYRKRSLYRALASLIKRVFVADGTVRGFFITPQDVNEYPGNFEKIR